MATSKADRQNITGQLEGLNQLRFLAAILVFTQHSLSSCQMDEWIDVAGFRIGRIGTALFFLLSGFLSATTTREPMTWLKDRVVMLFPPYWIVTVTGFILAAVTATKTFDTWQVFSQLAGMGYFTHGDHIVNIATWFISPLLLLYLAATLTRLISLRFMTPVVISVAIAAALSITGEYSAVRCHMATYFMAFAVASVAAPYRLTASVISASGLLVLSAFNSEFRYGALASLLLIPALTVQAKVAWCNWFSKIAYEWFLVHGLCLATVSHLTDNRLAIVLVSGLLSIAASLALQKFVLAMKKVVTRPTKKQTSDESRVLHSMQNASSASDLPPIRRLDTFPEALVFATIESLSHERIVAEVNPEITVSARS